MTTLATPDDCLVLLLFVLSVVAMGWWEFSRYNTYLTPFFLLAVPYGLLVCIAFFFGPALGFLPLYMPSVLVWTVGLLILGLTGQAVHYLFGRRGGGRQAFWLAAFDFGSEARARAMVLWTGTGVLTLLLASFYLVVSSRGWSAAGREDFGQAYAGGGLFGHVYQVAMILLLFLVGVASLRDRVVWVYLALMLFCVFMYLVKSWFFIPLLGGIIYRLFLMRFTLSRLVLLAAIGFAVFALNYFIQSVSYYQQYYSGFYVWHFLKYVFAGPLGFGEYLRQGLPVGGDEPVFFSPVINAFRFFAGGSMISNVNELRVYIHSDYLPDSTSNVFTFFGSIFITLGGVGGAAFVVLVGLVLYTILFLVFRTGNAWFLVLYAFLSGGLLFGWFDYYFHHLTFLECPVYILLFYLISQRLHRPHEKGLVAR